MWGVGLSRIDFGLRVRGRKHITWLSRSTRISPTVKKCLTTASGDGRCYEHATVEAIDQRANGLSEVS